MESKLEELIGLSKLAEQAERYEDMFEYMQEVVKTESKLNDEQRNLFSVAAKNVVGAKRSSWRVISELESKSKDSDESKAGLIKKYRGKIEKELEESCHKVLDLLEKYLVNATDDFVESEAKVFYKKMQGDYYRYLVEVASADKQSDLSQKSESFYQSATDLAAKLPSTHPIRLGLALNFSVFYYEILGDQKKACELAKKAFDDAIAELDAVKEDSYKDSTLIMQLLRDNLTLWTSESN